MRRENILSCPGFVTGMIHGNVWMALYETVSNASNVFDEFRAINVFDKIVLKNLFPSLAHIYRHTEVSIYWKYSKMQVGMKVVANIT